MYKVNSRFQKCCILILFLICITPSFSQTQRAWMRWDYDVEGTHFYPFPSNSGTDLKNYQLLWSVNRNIWGVLTGDIDGDGFIEIAGTDHDTLRVFDYYGNIKWKVDLDGDIACMSDINNDQLPDILVSNIKYSSTIGTIAIFDGFGNHLKDLTAPVASNGSLFRCWAEDFDLDGNVEVSVDVGAAWSGRPRGVYMLDYTSGNLDWFYSVGPSGWSHLGDVDEDAKKEFIFGGGSWHNGGSGDGVNHTATMTTDGDIYSIAFNAEDGSELFTQNYFFDGQSNGYVEHAVADPDGDGDYDVIAFEGHSGWYHGNLQVHLINENGMFIKTWNGPYISSGDIHGSSWAIGDINGDGYDEIIVSFQNYDKLWVLDHNLNEIRSRSFGHPFSWGESYHVISDIDGDGANEILVSDLNGGRLRILDEYLNDLYSFPTAIAAQNVIISDLNNDGFNEIIVCGTKLWVFGISIINATIDIDPDALNLQSNGKWITCYIEVPEDYNLNDIDVSSIKINQIEEKEVAIPAEIKFGDIRDFDEDGFDELMVKFKRKDVQNEIPENIQKAIIQVTGKVENMQFVGQDTIKIIDNGQNQGVSSTHDFNQLNNEFYKPDKFVLHQNYPNPFNPETVIMYELPKNSHVQLTVYNVTGEKVTTLVDSEMNSGIKCVKWNGKDSFGTRLPAGTYFCSIKSGAQIHIIRMLLMK